MGWDRVPVCVDCGIKKTLHQTGRCSECRKISCKECGKRFSPQKNWGGLTIRCIDCEKNRQKKMRNVDPMFA